MQPIQNRRLEVASLGNGRIRLSWSPLESDPANAAFFVEHMVGGTWRFPSDVTTIDATTVEIGLDVTGSQQFRVIAPDGTPSETATVDVS